MEQRGMTVSQLNLIVAEAIRKDPRVHSVTVRGEVSGFRHHLASGHWYFSLKDENSAISCVMFRVNSFKAKLRPRDGDSVVVDGYVDVYPKNGSYQLYATGMSPAGLGDLYAQLEELKRKLYAEGLFDPQRKRTLPMVPRKVAVITSRSGAALQDILNVSGLRSPSVPIVLIPVTVQGERAATEVTEGIRLANEKTDADVIIIARGGGSAEDLFCFNDEKLARAVAASRIPIVSGVGHEIDTTLCDLAADVRASTPSNAAEMVFPDRKELRSRTEALRQGLARAVGGTLNRAAQKTREAAMRLSALSPGRRIMDLNAASRLKRETLNHAMLVRLTGQGNALELIRKRLEYVQEKRMNEMRGKLGNARERLEALNPMAVLDRGYAMVTSREGEVLIGREQAIANRNITICFRDGTVDATVQS